MTVEEIFYQKVVKNGGKSGNPYTLETRSYFFKGKAYTEKTATFFLDDNMGKASLCFSITDEEYDCLLEKMKEREKENGTE